MSEIDQAKFENAAVIAVLAAIGIFAAGLLIHIVPLEANRARLEAATKQTVCDNEAVRKKAGLPATECPTAGEVAGAEVARDASFVAARILLDAL